jgi:hypothetical protein
MTVQSFNMGGKPAEAVYLGDLKLWPAAAAIDQDTVVFQWGAPAPLGVGAPRLISTLAEVDAQMGSSAAGGKTQGVGGSDVRKIVVGQAVSQPAANSFRYFIPAHTADGPEYGGMVIPITHAPVPADDRLYKITATVTVFNAPNKGVPQFAAMYSPAPLSYAAPGTFTSPPQSAAQINALISSPGLVFKYMLTTGFAQIMNSTSFQFEPAPPWSPATHALQDYEQAIGDIQIIRQEVHAP